MSPSPRRQALITSDTGPCAIVPLWLIRAADLSNRALRLYSLIAAEYADYVTGNAWPSRRTLAKALGTSPKSIDRALDELKQRGALTVEPRYDQQGQTSNMYRVLRVDPSPSSVVTRGVVTDDQRPSSGVQGSPSSPLTNRTRPTYPDPYERERLLSFWISTRAQRGLERFVDATAQRWLRKGIEDAIASGYDRRDLAAAIEKRASEPFADPRQLLEWVAAQAEEREGREDEVRKARERAQADRDRAANAEAERAALRAKYPGKSMREILVLEGVRPGLTRVGAGLARTA